MNDKKTDKDDSVIYDDENVKKTKSDTKSDDSDIVPDEENESLEVLVKKLREKLKVCEKEKQEYMDGWQRERADFVNYKKRVESEKVDLIKYANEGLLEELLPVLDSFEMAYSNKEVWEKVDKNWRTGVEYIHSHLIKVLADNGIIETNPVGEKFDPALHIAESMEATEDKSKDGIILAVNKKGYSLNSRVIVAPKVVVGEMRK